jgi:ABC-type transport system involved in multi-copper enzyme maturation permease subunit
MPLRLPNLGMPMLAKDLREMAQRPRTYAVRVAFALLTFSISAVLFYPTYYWARNSPLGILGRGGILLFNLYVVEWFGLCLFVPAIVSGAIAAEKERDTLQLLFLTRLGPWTILIEKLLSRFASVATFLLVSILPLLVAYALGGVGPRDVEFAAIGLAATAFQVGCVSLFCSAFCATTSSAFLLSYVVLGFLFFFPALTYAAVYVVDPSLVTPFLGSGWHVWLNCTQGITAWYLNPAFAFRPYHVSLLPLLVISGSGAMFLVLARLVIVRRAVPQPKYRIRRILQWIDRVLARVNDRVARGVVVGRAGDDLPKENPVVWRESRRGNLGQINYLVRFLFLLELPILLPTAYYVLTTTDLSFSALEYPALLLWLIAVLVVLARASGLFAAERSRQTLDVLLATPLPLAALVGGKTRALWRVVLVVSVPIFLHALLRGYLQASYSYGGRRWSYYLMQGFDSSQSARFYVVMEAVYLVLVLGLAAQLAFLLGLLAKTQGRALTAALGVFVAWCFLPLIVRRYTFAPDQMLYFSPITGLLANEFVDVNNSLGFFEPDSRSSGFYLMIHCGLFAAIVATLAWVNHVLASRVLLRPARRAASAPSSSLHLQSLNVG